MQALPPHLDELTVGALYFVSSPPDTVEGNLRIGFARVTKDVVTNPDDSQTVRFENKMYDWSDMPSFKAARNQATGSNRWCSTEPLQNFLPLAPALTTMSQQERNKEKPRLTSSCMRRLRELPL
eukprot:2356927-Pleurochrysis_carterae.AAC.1